MDDKLFHIKRKKGDKTPLYIHIYEKLFHLIETNYFKLGEKLPSENTLAKKLGVSRSSLRQALLILQEDGIIHNVQGKGNFVVKDKKDIDIGIEKLCSVINAFNNKEYDDIVVDVKYELPTNWVKNVLQINNNTLVLVLCRTYKVETEYVCYNVSIIPYDEFSIFDIDIGNSNEILSFFDNELYDEVSSSRMEIKLTTSGDYIAEKLNIPEGEMLLFMEETMFKETGEPLVISKSYFRPEYYDFHINRRRH